MFSKILKRWYLFPISFYLLFRIFDLLVFSYINPVILKEGEEQDWKLNSKSYKLEVTCNYIGSNSKAYLYKIKSTPSGLLNEEWGSLTELLYSRPVGLLFGNYDLDQDKELLVLGCEAGISKTVIPSLTKNIQKYNYKDMSYMGYYDFTGKDFQFKQIQDSPFFSVIKNEYIDRVLIIPEIWVVCFVAILTGILILFNYLISKFIRYIGNKKVT